jgi:S1-C subfamily serine protease
VHGLEVVGVDSNSPAERSGLRGRGTMTKLGASGATAGALMPPLDLVVMPLLKKSGQLGEGGDLIVAIDDKRIDSEADLETELDMLKPGDTIYFTIERARRDDSRETLKIPVKLGDASRSADNRSRDNATGKIVPLTPSH